MTIPRDPPDPLLGLADLEPRETKVLDDISVVVPTLGRTLLDKVLASMVSGTVWPHRIILVDQSGGEEMARMLEQVEALGVRTHRVVSAPRGRSAALNLGIAEVKTRHFAVTDDDCVVAPDWLQTLRDTLLANEGAIVSGQVEDVGPEDPLTPVHRTGPEIRTRPSLIYDRMVGGNCGMPTHLFAEVGPFDEDPRLRLAEDTEYAYRTLRAGFRLVFSPDIVVWHYAWRDAGQRDRQLRGYARSHGAFYGRYLRRGDAFMALKALIHLGRASRRWLRSSLAGDENLAAHGKAYTLQLLPGIIDGMRAEERETA
jgi:GT2 family glycosyltransferase